MLTQMYLFFKMTLHGYSPIVCLTSSQRRSKIQLNCPYYIIRKYVFVGMTGKCYSEERCIRNCLEFVKYA